MQTRSRHMTSFSFKWVPTVYWIKAKPLREACKPLWDLAPPTLTSPSVPPLSPCFSWASGSRTSCVPLSLCTDYGTRSPPYANASQQTELLLLLLLRNTAPTPHRLPGESLLWHARALRGFISRPSRCGSEPVSFSGPWLCSTDLSFNQQLKQ